jgi:hypothetical protein
MPATQRKPWRLTAPRYNGPFFAPVEKRWTHLYPHVCFACRSCFRRPVAADSYLRPCPRCHGPAIPLWTKFKPPPRDDGAQWAKVEALARHGFFFLAVGEPYPDTPREVEGFAARQAAAVERWRGRWPDYYVQLATALSRD